MSSTLLARIILLTLSFLFVSSNSLKATAQEIPPPVMPQLPDASGRQGQSDETTRMEREARKAANKERQAKLKSDTEQLLKLATELKEYVDKTNENILSLDVVKKADQIEKLARSVKEKMRANN